MIQSISGIGCPRLYEPSKPVRNPEYLKFIRKLPCSACGSTRRIEAAHTGPHGMSQKASDLQCIPLCDRCHPRFDADPRGEAQRCRIDVPALVSKLNRFWFEKLNGGAA
jgi:hypothetical protein